MIIGTCGNCGGPVETDMEGVGHCRRCGSRVKNPFGRVIPMEPPLKDDKTDNWGKYLRKLS